MSSTPWPQSAIRPVPRAMAAGPLASTDMGLSQEDFADRCGIDRSYMGCVERGERNLALVNVDKIVKALGMAPSEFFKALDAPPAAAEAGQRENDGQKNTP